MTTHLIATLFGFLTGYGISYAIWRVIRNVLTDRRRQRRLAEINHKLDELEARSRRDDEALRQLVIHMDELVGKLQHPETIREIEETTIHLN